MDASFVAACAFIASVVDRVEVYLKPAGAAVPGEPTIAFSGAAG